MKRSGPFNSKFILTYFFFLVLSFGSYSQIDQKDYLFTSINTENGLSNNVVFDIFQDRDGYMWFATNNGLNRYDGYSITSFFHSESDSTTIPSNVVRCMIEDKRADLWIATKEGLNRFNPRSQNFDELFLPKEFGLPGNQIMSMDVDASGKIWMTIGDVVSRFNPDSSTFEVVKDFDSFMVELTLGFENVWIGNADGEIYHFDLESNTLSKRASNIPVNTIHFGESSSSLWIPSEFQDYAEVSTIRSIPKLPNDLNPKHLVELDERLSWIGTDNGLFEYDFSTKKLFKIPVGISALSNQIRSLFKDPAGGIWVGTLGGVFHYDPYRKVFDHRDLVKESDDIVMAMHAGENGIYANCLASGIYFKAHDTKEFEALVLPDDYPFEGFFIWDMELVSESKYPLWLATNDGVICLNPLTSDFRTIDLPLSESDEKISFSIFDSNRDFLWISSHRALHKVNKQDGKVLQTFSLREDIEYPGIQKVLEKSNRVFVATENQGLFEFNQEAGEFLELHMEGSYEIFGSSIWDLHATKSTLWIGANNGLYKLNFQDDQIEPVLEDNHAIFSIAEDDGGMLWLGSDKGIKSFDRSNQKTRSYGTIDGLRNIEFNRKSVMQDASGKLWFGGVNGITSFDPELVNKDNPNPPQAHITSLRVATSDSTFSISNFENQVTLPWEHNTIELDFVGLSFTNSAQNNYRYTMEGHDPNWVTVNEPSIARYVKLPVGRYSFRVHAANSDGVWSASGDELRITIEPPLWRTKIAYLLYVLSFLGLVWLVRRLQTYRNRISQVEEEKVLIAKKVEEKFIVLNSKTKVYLKDLKYIKAAGNYLEFYTTDKTLMDRNKLKDVEAQLPPNFIRTHRSYILNKNFIHSANSTSVFVKPNIETPLSRTFKGSLK
ncbi:MAG: two-component regulator propeller domain-containing protein [Bacteroidota bacterium]